MAVRGGEATSDLFLRLGLNFDELNNEFVQAERTVRDNMSRLARANTVIDLQAQVEIAGLDENADAARILEIRLNSLNQQIVNQRDRVRLAEAAWQSMVQQHGAASDQAQRAEVLFQRERLALARLEEQTRNLTQAQEDLNNNGDGESGGGFLDQINQLTDINGLLDSLSPKAKVGYAAIAAIGAATIAAVSATKDLVDKWSELQTQAYELNMTVNDTESFLRHMKLAGGDIGDFEGFIRGISDAYVKGRFLPFIVKPF